MTDVTIPLIAVKSHKAKDVSPDSADPKPSLFFKRKSQISLIQYNETKTHILGEFDGKRGWFPASHARPLNLSKDEGKQKTLQRSQSSLFGSSSSNVSLLSPKNDVSKMIAKEFLKKSPSTAADIKEANVLIKLANKAKSPEDFIKRQSSDGLKMSSISLSKIPHVNEHGVPLLITSVVKFVREKYLDEENIFRASGLSSEVERLRETTDRGEAIDFSKASEPHSACVALKLFLRELDEPLATYDLIQSFQTAFTILQDEGKRRQQFRTLLDLLPPQNYNVMKTLVEFFVEIVAHQSKNMMTVANLSRIVSQALFRESALTIDKGQLQLSYDITEYVISHFSELFSDFQDTRNLESEKSKETRRKREKEHLSVFLKSEKKRKDKESKNRKSAGYEGSSSASKQEQASFPAPFNQQQGVPPSPSLLQGHDSPQSSKLVVAQADAPKKEKWQMLFFLSIAVLLVSHVLRSLV